MNRSRVIALGACLGALVLISAGCGDVPPTEREPMGEALEGYKVGRQAIDAQGNRSSPCADGTQMPMREPGEEGESSKACGPQGDQASWATSSGKVKVDQAGRPLPCADQTEKPTRPPLPCDAKRDPARPTPCDQYEKPDRPAFPCDAKLDPAGRTYNSCDAKLDPGSWTHDPQGTPCGQPCGQHLEHVGKYAGMTDWPCVKAVMAEVGLDENEAIVKCTATATPCGHQGLPSASSVGSCPGWSYKSPSKTTDRCNIGQPSAPSTQDCDIACIEKLKSASSPTDIQGVVEKAEQLCCHRKDPGHQPQPWRGCSTGHCKTQCL